jgi:hypothetical protein
MDWPNEKNHGVDNTPQKKPPASRRLPTGDAAKNDYGA